MRCAASFAAFAALVLWLAVTAPLSQSLQPIAAPSFLVLAADGQPIARRGAVRGAPVDVMKLPPHVGQAFIAIEDRRFFHHVGIDPWSIGRALFRNWQAGRVREGGSTISQQLAKTSFTGGERTLGPQGAGGVDHALARSAAVQGGDPQPLPLQRLFRQQHLRPQRRRPLLLQRRAGAADAAQAAMLAGLVNAPNRLAPNRNLAGAQRRARLVLRTMADIGFIGEAQVARPRPARLRLAPSDNLPTGTYFADWILPGVQNADQEEYGERRVATTLERRLQRAAIRAFRASGSATRQAALVAMRPDGADRGDAGRPRLWAQPVQPRDDGAPPAGLDLQAVRLSRRLRSGLHPDSTDRGPADHASAAGRRATPAASIAARSRCATPSRCRATSPRCGSPSGSASATSSRRRATSASPRRSRTIPASRSAPPTSACSR